MSKVVSSEKDHKRDTVKEVSKALNQNQKRGRKKLKMSFSDSE